jgi:hypothetical protein
MAWVERHGRTWRVRYWMADGRAGSIPGFATREAARAHADHMGNAPQAPPVLAPHASETPQPPTPATSIPSGQSVPEPEQKSTATVGEWAERAARTLRDLDWTPDTDVEVAAVAVASQDGLNVLRHSTAHVLAQAVQQLWPEARLGIGPSISSSSGRAASTGTRPPSAQVLVAESAEVQVQLRVVRLGLDAEPVRASAARTAWFAR